MSQQEQRIAGECKVAEWGRLFRRRHSQLETATAERHVLLEKLAAAETAMKELKISDAERGLYVLLCLRAMYGFTPSPLRPPFPPPGKCASLNSALRVSHLMKSVLLRVVEGVLEKYSSVRFKYSVRAP